MTREVGDHRGLFCTSIILQIFPINVRRLCKYCLTKETECHFFLECHQYQSVRQSHFDTFMLLDNPYRII